MSKVQVIIGSTRPGRAADLVAPWVIATARAHGEFDVEVLDLRDLPLPIFAENLETVGDFQDPTYSTSIVRSWNRKIAEASAYLVVTPEYNHSVPAVLKNAIDSVFVSFAFRQKPIVAVGYSGGIAGVVRAIEHLTQIAVEAEMVPLRTAVVIPQVAQAFTAQGSPINPVTELSLWIALEDLKWWSDALQVARSSGQLAPAAFRIQAAVAAMNEQEAEAV